MRLADKICLWSGVLVALAFVAVMTIGHLPP
jgi:hypothetical protein